MRVLWITHDVFDAFFPFVSGKPTKGGSWISPLFYSLMDQPGFQLGSVTPVLGAKRLKIVIDGVSYYSIPIKGNENSTFMGKSLAEHYLWAVGDFKPDIIHVHGTEKNFALLRSRLDRFIPIVCSIQGVVAPCHDYLKMSVANINLRKQRSLKNRLGRGGVKQALRVWKRYIPVEREIFRSNSYFIGRTEWDRAHVMALNPGALYYHGEELLRSTFYSTKWDPAECERYRVFVPSGDYPLKGFHVLLEAAAMLKGEFPGLKVVVPLHPSKVYYPGIRRWLIAEDYSNYLRGYIKKFRLEENILLQGRLSAEEMAEQYRKAHVFVLPSFIENSPNSLGESMMVGTPSVVSAV